MKRYFFALIFLIISLQMKAQYNTMYYSVGRTVFGTFDIRGVNAMIGYERQLKKWIGVKSQFNLSSATFVAHYDDPIMAKIYAYNYDVFSNTAFKFQIGPSFKFINSRRHILNLDILALIANHKIVSNSGFLKNFDENAPREWSYFRYPAQYDIGTGFGGMAQVGYRFKINRKIGFGLDYNLQLYNGGNGERNINLVFQNTF